MEDGAFGVVVIALVVAAASVALVLVGRASTAGRLRPNPWAGIRLPSTMASEAAWYAAHRAAGPVLTAGGTVTAVVAVLAAVLALAGTPSAGLLLVMVAIALLLTATLWSGFVGHKAAVRVR